VSIHGLGERAWSNHSSVNQWREYAAANAVSYASEILERMSTNVCSSIESIRGTETIVPPFANPSLPPFESHQYPSYGKNVLLVIPTANKAKGNLLKDLFSLQSPQDTTVHSITVPFESGVGEQPYNEAGVLGAHNRITHVLHYLTAHPEILDSHQTGTVIVASIENYVQVDHVKRPTDYGVVVVHNATTGITNACLSRGVTISPRYVDRARRFGSEMDPNHGNFTVGKIIAANVPGIDHANWHEVVAGCSRYTLLSDAVRELEIPW
jgi:hypothetical protein